LKNYFNYFTEVEEHFVRKRGKNLLVAPLDWCLIELWRDCGIPLQVALRGIERSFETAERRHKRSPASLAYCHPAVLEAFEEYRQAMVGASEEPGDPDSESPESESVVWFLDHLHKQLSQREGESWSRAADKVQTLKLQRPESSAGFRELDRDLGEVGAILAQELRETLDRDQVRQQRSEVRQELRVYKKRLSTEMYQRIESSYLDRKTLAQFDLPEFSLLGAQAGVSGA